MRACTRLVHLCWRLLGGQGFFHFHLFKRTCTVLCQCLLSLRREVGSAGDGTCRCGRAIDRTWRFVASVLSLCLFHVAETANAKKVPQGLFFWQSKKSAVWFIGGAAVVSPYFLCLFYAAAAGLVNSCSCSFHLLLSCASRSHRVLSFRPCSL